MKNIFSIIILLLIFCNLSFSQYEIDTLVYEDTSETYIEELMEQTTEEEDSPLLDVTEFEMPVVDKVNLRKTSIALRSRVSRKLQLAQGYVSGKYLGTHLKSYQRVRVEQGENVSAGLLFEKDAGEKYFNDFTNGYIQVKDIWLLKSLILGDFIFESGQGLVLWRGYDFQKGAIITAGTFKEGKELKPHLSSDENGFLRGAAASFEFSNISASIFYSRKYLSASIDSFNNVTSIYNTGYFRTESEISKRANLVEILYGSRVSYSYRDKLKLGITGYTTEFSRNLFLYSGKKYTGQKYGIAGSDYIVKFGEIKLFGELAYTSTKYSSGVTGIMITPSSQVKLLALYRNYSHGYFGRYANPFGENYGGSNENGFYVGMQLAPVKRFKVSGYYDQFVFPVSSSLNYPVHGNEKFLQLESKFIKNIDIYLRYRQKQVDKKAAISDDLNREVGIIDLQNKNNYKLNVDYYLNRNFKFRFRIEYQTVGMKSTDDYEIGKMFYQELTYRGSNRLTIKCRVSLFKSDSFNSGISQYENDLPGVLTIPVLYGRGVKWYVLAKYSLLNTLDLSAKYSYLIREDVKKIGSGWDELPGNYDNKIGIQIDFKF
ncbi:MAG: hypothetical protein QME25_05890 [Bacteroidota bacterium]|nr:hypothetical protein [Bacteroidota bacterium]